MGNPHPHTRNKGEEQWRDIPVPAAAHPSASQACKPSSRASQVPETPAALWAASKTSSVPLTSQETQGCSTPRAHSRAGQGRGHAPTSKVPHPSCHPVSASLATTPNPCSPSLSSPSLLWRERGKWQNHRRGSSAAPQNKEVRTRSHFAAEIQSDVSRAEGRSSQSHTSDLRHPLLFPFLPLTQASR